MHVCVCLLFVLLSTGKSHFISCICREPTVAVAVAVADSFVVAHVSPVKNQKVSQRARFALSGKQIHKHTHTHTGRHIQAAILRYISGWMRDTFYRNLSFCGILSLPPFYKLSLSLLLKATLLCVCICVLGLPWQFNELSPFLPPFCQTEIIIIFFYWKRKCHEVC